VSLRTEWRSGTIALFIVILWLSVFVSLKGRGIVNLFLIGMESLKAWRIGFLCCNLISRLAGVA
jgi:hypothetical protein